ncbi:MAG: asparagine synthase (glutamine-hydrolyzing), partial [Ignavibacteria bacterium]
MCGINGIVYFNSYNSNEHTAFFEDKISRMNDEIAHRGPDDDGKFFNYPVNFGFRRLRIIDLSTAASQPMFNEDRSIALIFNGEIYNYLELIPDLKKKGYIFKTKSDTEVIIHSYKEYGFDCVNKFNGMWAFALYDLNNKIFFASRDRFGVKPFYYYSDKDKFIFSSEIKAILKVQNINEANHGKVFDYLAYGYKTSNGDTFFNGISELKPAHNVIIKNEIIEFKRYWHLNNKESVVNENEINEKISYLLKDSVKLRFRSDVPVSILLSGGLDSSIITRITDDLIDNHQLNNENVTAYSAVFPGFRYDESAIIDDFLKTCRHIRSVKLSLEKPDLFKSINKFVYGMGEPVFSATSFAHYTLMKDISKQNVKVVLNGQGADEVWGGYDRYFIGYFLLDILMRSPHKFISQANAIFGKMKFSYKYILMQTLKALSSRKYASYLRAKYAHKVLSCMSKDFTRNNYNYFKNSEYKKLSSGNLSGYMKYNIEYQGFNQILHYEDHSSMQNSIEMRSPFIDYRLVELAF